MNNINLVQNVLLIWLDSNIDDKNNEDCQYTITQLRQIVNLVKIFTDTDKCIDFLTDVKNENVFIVISDLLSHAIIPLIYEVTQLNAIFIFSGNKIKQEPYTKEWSKIKGVFAETSIICEAVEQAARQYEQNDIFLSFFSTALDASSQDHDQLDQSYMYTQILKEILLTIDFNEEHVKEFRDYCEQQFTNDDHRLNCVRNFEQTYRLNTPISLYTQGIFLYSMLNRALRVMDVDIIMKMSFFVCDLHRHISELHRNQFGTQHSPQSFVVYRGQGLPKTDFDQMVKSQGGLISFNYFLSASKNREVSLAFAQSNRDNADMIGILFVMTIELSRSTTPFASIREFSRFQDEDEILFAMHTIFRILEIKQMDTSKRLWQVNLSLTTDSDRDLHVLTERIRQETYPDAEGWQRLGLFLLKIGQSDKAEQIYTVLLKRTHRNREKAALYHQLGYIKQNQGNYSEAIVLYESSLEFMQKSLRPNHPHLAASYNDIGNVYQNMHEYSKAISFYKKALEIQQKNLPSNHPHLASSYSNIGSAYYNMKEYATALSFYEKAVEIQRETLPPNHPDFATAYNNIGSAYHEMGEHLKALSFYEIALEIRLKTLPPNHPHLVDSYKNIGSVYQNMGQHSKAQSFYQKAREIR